jgi:fumarate hydratase class II
MPGKVNPTQAEAMLMVCIQVIGSDTAVAMAGNEGNFELNAFRPIIINNVLHSIRILADMADHFRKFLVEGVQLNTDQLQRNVDRSVMMVTALSPVIGYDRASEIAHLAINNDLTLKQAALQRGVSEDLFDRVVVPVNMTRPGTADMAAARH